MATAPKPTMSDVRAPYSTRAQTSRAETSVPSRCSAVGGCRAPVEKSIQLGGHGVSSGAKRGHDHDRQQDHDPDDGQPVAQEPLERRASR